MTQDELKIADKLLAEVDKSLEAGDNPISATTAYKTFMEAVSIGLGIRVAIMKMEGTPNKTPFDPSQAGG